MAEESISLESLRSKVKDLDKRVEKLKSDGEEQGDEIVNLVQEVESNSNDIVGVKNDLPKLNQIDRNTALINDVSRIISANDSNITDLNRKLPDAHRQIDEKVSKNTTVFIRRNVGDQPYLSSNAINVVVLDSDADADVDADEGEWIINE